MKKERIYKLIIIAITLLLIVAGFITLTYTGIIHFKFTDSFLNKQNYEKNKSKERRILIIGDSQLEKWPLQHCLAKDIENFCLEENIGCINAAHHGFGPIEYFDRAETITPDYSPDLIVVFYYVGNDLSDVLYRSDVTPKQPSYDVFPAESEKADELRKKDAEKLTQVNLFSPIPEDEKQKMLAGGQFDWKKFKDYGIDTTLIRYAQNRILYPNMIGKEYVNPWLLVNALYMPFYLNENTLINTDNSRYAWYRVIKYLSKIATLAKKSNSELCIVSIPNNVQVDSSHFDFYRKLKFNVTNELLTGNTPQNELEAFARHFGIKHVNLLNVFKEKNAAIGSLYFENDDHLSEKGHTIAFEELKNKILIPYQNKNLSSFVNDNNKKYHLIAYSGWAIPYVINNIINTKDWYSSVKDDAGKRNISVDSALKENAKYSIENEK